MIVITGAAGFIGSCLLSKLNKEGFKDIVLVDDFSDAEKNKIVSFMDQSIEDCELLSGSNDVDFENRQSLDISLNKNFMDEAQSHKDSYCGAGKTFVRMTPKGDTYRCYGESTYMGNLFDGSFKLFDELQKCKSNKCYCTNIGHFHAKEAQRILEGEGLEK